MLRPPDRILKGCGDRDVQCRRAILCASPLVLGSLQRGIRSKVVLEHMKGKTNIHQRQRVACSITVEQRHREPWDAVEHAPACRAGTEGEAKGLIE